MTTTLQPLGGGTETSTARTAKLLDGSVVIVWLEYSAGFLADYDIKYQVFDPFGGTRSLEQELSTFLVGTTFDPGFDLGLTALTDGGFAISYDFVNEESPSQSFTTIRTFDSRGSATDYDYVAYLNAFGTLAEPDEMNRLTGLADGGWLYTFSYDGGGGPDVYYSRFDAIGNPVNLVPLRAHQSTAGDHDLGSAIALDTGGFLMVYRVTDSSGQDIRARAFDTFGNAAGPEFVVVSKAAASGLEIESIRTTSMENGNHAIIWTEANGLDATLKGRIINDQGATVGATFQVSDTTGGVAHSVSALPETGFLVSWVDGDLSSGGTNDHVRAFNSDGAARGASKLVDGRFLNEGHDASVQALDSGGYITLIDSGLSNNQILFQIHDQASNWDDVLYMVPSDDWFSGLGGDDLIYGTNENDSIFGSWGEDTVYAGAGDDFVRLGAGDLGRSTIQHAYGGEGNDVLQDSSAEAFLHGGAGADIIRAGSGNDTLKGGIGRDLLQAGFGDDLVYGGGWNDTIYGSSGADELYGGDGFDIVHGGSDNDLIKGGRGNDTLYGNIGDDWLHGGGQNDLLVSGEGDDTLTGNSGADTFRFNGQNFGQDIITDFEDGIDKITFSADVATTFGDVSISSWDSYAVIAVGGGQILVQSSAGQIGASDFVF